MAIKKISDSVKLESLNETDTLLVNHDGMIAQVAGNGIGGGKPIMFKPSLAAGGLVVDGRLATPAEVLDAYFAGNAYLEAVPADKSTNNGCLAGRIDGFYLSANDGNVQIKSFAGNSNDPGCIIPINPPAFIELFNSYFA